MSDQTNNAATQANTTSSSNQSAMFFSSLPRLRASQTLAAIEEFRASEQALFALESSHFPSMAAVSFEHGGGGDAYSKMWQSFKSKDQELRMIVKELETVTSHCDAIHSRTSTTSNNSTQPTSSLLS